MFSLTGPVMTKPSACRGEATNWMPNRPRSKTTVPSTFRSASHAPDPPALTWRSLSDRPKSRRVFWSKAWRIGQAWRWCPVYYMLFDLLYHGGRSLLEKPLARRREMLAELCAALGVPSVQFSAGVVGRGRAFYEAVLAQGHEGVLAKHLASRYRAGRRSPAWRKIKPGRRRSLGPG